MSQNKATVSEVVFLSRHEMTEQQKTSLLRGILPDGRVFDKPDSVTFRSDPVIFAARGYEAAQYLIEYARRLGDTTLVCSVMPAHVAAAYAALTAQERHAPSIGLPVAVPAPAKEGEVRGGGFVHSHWEFI